MVAPAGFTWSATSNFSMSVPVYPTTASLDIFTVPAGLAPGSANALMVMMASWDPAQTFQITNADASIFPVRGADVSVIPVGGAESTGTFLLGANGVRILPALSDISFGGLRGSFFYETTSDANGAFALSAGALNAGAIVRVRVSANTSSVTGNFTACAALLSGSQGVFPQLYGVFPQRNLGFWFGSASGSISIQREVLPPSIQPANAQPVAWIAYGAGVDIANNFPSLPVSTSNPNFALDAAWANLQVNHSGPVWAGIGYLASPGLGATAPYSVFAPNAVAQNAAVLAAIDVVSDTSVLPGRSSVQVIG